MNNKKPKRYDFGKRLNILTRKKGFNNSTLSSATGISYYLIKLYSEGISRPSRENLQLICDVLDTTPSCCEYNDFQDIDAYTEVDCFLSLEEMVSMIPVINWSAARQWVETMWVGQNDVIASIPRLPHFSSNAFGLRMHDQSMLPRFKPGDTIYVEPNIAPWELKDGDLIVVHCNDAKEATFKQLVIGETSDDMYLKPLNPDWHEQKMVPMSECTLVGIADTKIEALR